MRRYFRTHGRVPVAFAGFLAFPLFFASLMASSLRFDEPTVKKAVDSAGKVTLTYGQTAPSTEAKIWVAALVPAAILLAVGVLSMLWRRAGVYVVCVSAAVLAVANQIQRRVSFGVGRKNNEPADSPVLERIATSPIVRCPSRLSNENR